MTDLNVKVGKEQEQMKPMKVTVKVITVEDVIDKSSGSRVGQKVILSVKHPKREELIKMSSARVLDASQKLKVQGLWYSLDADGNIAKRSTVGQLLDAYECETLSQLIGKDIDTVQDGMYLVAKAI